MSLFLQNDKTTPINCLHTARIDIFVEPDVGYASLDAKHFAENVGFSTVDQYMISTAVSELARNIITYAKEGVVYLKEVQQGPLKGIEVVAQDWGPGIEDLDKALSDNYSTNGTMGVGLPGTKRLMDYFDITTEPGKGTEITVRKWL